MGPSGFRVKPFGVVAGRDEEGCRGVGTDPEEIEEVGNGVRRAGMILR